MRRLSKKRLLALALILVAVASAFFAISGFFDREPVYQGKTVSDWSRDLNSPVPSVRSNATAALQTLGPKAVPYLVRALRKSDPILKKPFQSFAPRMPLWMRRGMLRLVKPFQPGNDRLAAATALVVLATNAPAEPLLKSLHDPERGVGYQSATALGRLGKPAVPGLITALNDSDSYVRSMACYGLGIVGRDAVEAIPGLISKFTDSAANIPKQSAYSLGRIGTEAIEPLLEATRSADERVRLHAILALGWIGPPTSRFAPRLIEMIKDERPAVRAAAVEVLGNIGPFTEESAASFRAALKDSDANVRTKALQSLGKIPQHAKSAMPELLDALNDKEPQVRGSAAFVLGQIGPSAESAVPALKALAKDESDFARSKAQEALDRIQPRKTPEPTAK